MNVVLLEGSLSSDPEERVLRPGDRLVNFEVTIRDPGAPTATVPVAWFEPPPSAMKLPAGAPVVVTGSVRRRFFRTGGATATRTEVVADRVTAATGRSRAAARARVTTRLAAAEAEAEGGEAAG